MKGKINQTEKYKTINDLKEEFKSMRGSQQKPKTTIQGINLNNSSLANKYTNPLKTISPGK